MEFVSFQNVNHFVPKQAEKEQKSTTNPSKLTACEITCIAYMAAGIFLSLRLDVVERWWQLLLVVCFFVMVGCFFGILASAEPEKRG